MTNVNATPSQFQINAQVCFGLSQFANTTLLNYIEPSTSTALFQSSTEQIVPSNSTNNQFNLATLFPGINTAVAYMVQDMSNPGLQLNWGLASSGQRFNMAPNGFFLVRVNGSSPILYIDNPSSNTNAIIQISCIAN